MSTEELLQERGKTHGNFADNSWIAQSLEDIMREGKNWEKLPAYMKEALHMTAHKIGRILSGDANFLDHWDDAAAYMKLPTKVLRGEL